MFSKLSEDEENILKIQEDFSNIIYGNDEEEKKRMIKNINVELFDAKSYTEYLNINNEIIIENLFNKFKNEYITQKKKKKKDIDFTKFCLTSLKTKCKDLSMKYTKNYESDTSFLEVIKVKINSIMKELNINISNSDDKNIKTISNILSEITNNLNQNSFYINSNCEKFFNALRNQIIKANDTVEFNFKNNMHTCFYYFDMILAKDIESDKSRNFIELKKDTNKLIDELEELKSKYEIEKIFDKYYEKIDKEFQNIKENKENLISEYKDIEKIIKELENKILNLLNKDLDNKINSIMENLDSELKIKKEKLKEILYIGLEDEIKRGKYKIQFEKIFNLTLYEKLKIKIFDKFGKKEKLAVYGSIGAFGLFVLVSTLTTNIIGLISSILYGIIVGIVPWIISLFKSKEKLLSEKVEKYEKEFDLQFYNIRRNFVRLYKDALDENQKLFKEFLSLACTNFCKMENQKWKQIRELYQEIKAKILLYINN